jgi:hypothetical protein
MATEPCMPSWLNDVSLAVSEATNVVQVQSEIEDLTAARADFAEHVAKLRRLAAANALGRGTWWAGQTAEPDVFSELKQASTNPQPRVVNSLLRKLDSYAGTVNALLIASWREYAASRMGNVADLQLLAGTLAGIEGVAGLAASLQEVLGQLGRVQAQPPTEESLALLDQAEKRLAALEAALQPAAAREFLAAVARGGASLALLTDEVRAWLAANRAELSFKIAAGAPDNS